MGIGEVPTPSRKPFPRVGGLGHIIPPLPPCGRGGHCPGLWNLKVCSTSSVPIVEHTFVVAIPISDARPGKGVRRKNLWVGEINSR